MRIPLWLLLLVPILGGCQSILSQPPKNAKEGLTMAAALLAEGKPRQALAALDTHEDENLSLDD